MIRDQLDTFFFLLQRVNKLSFTSAAEASSSLEPFWQHAMPIHFCFKFLFLRAVMSLAGPKWGVFRLVHLWNQALEWVYDIIALDLHTVILINIYVVLSQE